MSIFLGFISGYIDFLPILVPHLLADPGMLAANFKLPAKNIVVSIGPVSVTRLQGLRFFGQGERFQKTSK